MGFLTKIYLRVDTPIQWMVFSWFLIWKRRQFILEWWMLLFKSSRTWRVLSFGVCSFQFVGKKKIQCIHDLFEKNDMFEKKTCGPFTSQLTSNSFHFFRHQKKLSPKTQPAQQGKKRQAPLGITHLEVARFPRPAKDSVKAIRWGRQKLKDMVIHSFGRYSCCIQGPKKNGTTQGSRSGPKLRKHLNIFEHQPRNAPDPIHPFE